MLVGCGGGQNVVAAASALKKDGGMVVLESTVIGLGHDVVDVASFSRQLTEPASRFLNLFSERERRQAALRARAKHDDEALHLAGKWAGKEAVLKAWCEALGENPNPYTLDDFPWAKVEILGDGRSRPHVVLGSSCEAVLRSSLRQADPNGATGVEEESFVAHSVGGSESAAVDVDRDCESNGSLCWHISLSHDGPVASAVAMLTRVVRS
jgi:holo-[acyl-carrier protein] synthase